MPARLKLIVAYDGTAFAGWQSQVHGNTIQNQLEKAFEQISGQEIRVHGAGRTDAGVHAIGQCAHVDLPDRKLDATRWQLALNGLLPPAIRVLRCRYVGATFHSRFSVRSKVYRYRIWVGPVLPPFEAGRAWLVRGPVDLEIVT